MRSRSRRCWRLSAAGAGVLMMRSVEFARRFNVPLHVRSSFHDGDGTWVKENTMEDAAVTGVAHDLSEVKLTVQGVPDRPGVASALFEPLSDAGINVDMIVQNTSHEGLTDISFTVAQCRRRTGLGRRQQAAARPWAPARVDVDDAIAKVSVVGAGMRTHPGIAATMFTVLAGCGHQHRDDLDLADPGVVRHRCRRRRARRCACSTTPSIPRSIRRRKRS